MTVIDSYRGERDAGMTKAKTASSTRSQADARDDPPLSDTAPADYSLKASLRAFRRSMEPGSFRLMAS